MSLCENLSFSGDRNDTVVKFSVSQLILVRHYTGFIAMGFGDFWVNSLVLMYVTFNLILESKNYLIFCMKRST